MASIVEVESGAKPGRALVRFRDLSGVGPISALSQGFEFIISASCRPPKEGIRRRVTKDKILIELSRSAKTKVYKEDFANQSFPQKVFSAIWQVEAEVNNGGFSQYFFNDSRASAWFVALALEHVGAPKTANIC